MLIGFIVAGFGVFCYICCGRGSCFGVAPAVFLFAFLEVFDGFCAWCFAGW